jgi:hypothetical protein
MVQEFIEWVLKQIGCLYVWGAQGQVMTPTLIYKLENSDKNYKRALAAFNDHAEKGLTLIAYDCSGLVVKYLLDNELIGHDTTANGLYFDQCNPISKSDLQPGDLVFKKYSTKNKMYHVGVYVGGGEYVVHAKGRDDGVVREKLSATGWNRFGRLKVFEKEIIEGSEGETMALRRGDKNAAVGQLQRDLTALGYTLADDNSYGPATEAMVLKFQRDNGLEVDGIAGPNTQAKIAELLEAKGDASEYAEKIKALEKQVKELTDKMMAMRGAFSIIKTTADKYDS